MRHTLQRLDGGLSAKLRQKLEPVGVDRREVPFCYAQLTQKVELLQLRQDRLGSVCSRSLAKLGKRRTVKLFSTHQELIELH